MQTMPVDMLSLALSVHSGLDFNFLARVELEKLPKVSQGKAEYVSRQPIEEPGTPVSV